MPREYPVEKVRNIGIIAHIDASLRLRRSSLKPSGFNISATGLRLAEVASATQAGKQVFSRPLSRVNVGE